MYTEHFIFPPGPPRDPHSLHFLDVYGGKPNAYEIALRAVGDIIQQYGKHYFVLFFCTDSDYFILLYRFWLQISCFWIWRKTTANWWSIPPVLS